MKKAFLFFIFYISHYSILWSQSTAVITATVPSAGVASPVPIGNQLGCFAIPYIPSVYFDATVLSQTNFNDSLFVKISPVPSNWPFFGGYIFTFSVDSICNTIGNAYANTGLPYTFSAPTSQLGGYGTHTLYITSSVNNPNPNIISYAKVQYTIDTISCSMSIVKIVQHKECTKPGKITYSVFDSLFVPTVTVIGPSGPIQSNPITVTSAGIYTINATNNVCSITDTVQVVDVGVVPVLTVTATPSITCYGQPITVSHPGADSFVVIQGSFIGSGGIMSYGTSTSVLPSASGVYTVIADNGKPCSSSKTFNVTVTPLTMPTFASLPSICQGNNLSLPSASLNGYLGSWIPAPNNQTTTTYTFQPNFGQCASTNVTLTQAIDTPLKPTFNPIPSICSGSTFTLPVLSANGITGNWQPIPNVISTTSYTFTPNSGQCAQVDSIDVLVYNTIQIPDFASSNIPDSLCAGTNYIFPTLSQNLIDGTWTPPFDKWASQTYTFTPNNIQCADTLTKNIFIKPTDTALFNIKPYICQLSTLTLPNSSLNGYNCTWQPSINYFAQTTYTCNFIGTGCVFPYQITITPQIQWATPIFNIPSIVCQGSTYVLPDTSSNGIYGTWLPSLNLQQPSVGNYTFTPASDQICPLPKFSNIEVVTNANPLFSPINPLCAGSIFTLNSQSINGISGVWSPLPNNQSSSTYTFTSASGCSPSTILPVTIIPTFQPTISISTNNNVYAIGQPIKIKATVSNVNSAPYTITYGELIFPNNLVQWGVSGPNVDSFEYTPLNTVPSNVTARISIDTAGSGKCFAQTVMNSTSIPRVFVGLDNLLPERISISPNPANTSIEIKNAGSNASLILYNYNGQIVNKIDLQAISTITLDISKYARGLYNIAVFDDSKVYRAKIILE